MTIVKGLVYLMKVLIWKGFGGHSYFLDPLRKNIQHIQKICVHGYI